MTAHDIINYFSSNLYFATIESKTYLIDDYVFQCIDKYEELQKQDEWDEI